MGLRTSVLYDDDVAVVALDGDLDLTGSSALGPVVDRAVADGATCFVLDLTHVAFCDATGLGAVLHASRTISAQGGLCVVAGCPPALRPLLDVSGVGDELALVEDIGLALTRLRADAHR